MIITTSGDWQQTAERWLAAKEAFTIIGVKTERHLSFCESLAATHKCTMTREKDLVSFVP